MDRCTDLRELLSQYIEDELDAQQARTVEDHLAGCEECAELAEAMREVIGFGADLSGLEPPEGLADDLMSSPCRLWLGLLFQAVDREISKHNLERLLTHLEACPSCRGAWQDLTLIHQVGDAMVAPPSLVNKCISAREKRPGMPRILNRRLATAAAYFLAVFTSLVVGNPVTLARSQAAPAVERVAQQISQEVSGVAEQGKGEVRVMMWRLWKWGERKVDGVRQFVSKKDNAEPITADETVEDQGEDS
jgi:anti-sigma factor RsiW